MIKLLHDAHFRRRALFLLGNLAMCAMIVGGLVMPVSTFFAERDNRIADQMTVLARMNAVAAQAKNVQSIISDTGAQMRGASSSPVPTKMSSAQIFKRA